MNSNLGTIKVYIYIVNANFMDKSVVFLVLVCYALKVDGTTSLHKRVPPSNVIVSHVAPILLLLVLLVAILSIIY